MRSIMVLLLAVVVIGAAGALLCSCGEEAEGPGIPDVEREPEAVLADYVGDSDDALPGIAVSVIKGGESAYRNVAGVRKRGTSDPVKVADAFHIGSDTKAMTALLCGVLIDRGLLSFSTTVGQVLGAGYAMREEYRAVTLEQLLCHISGIPGELPSKTWATFFPYDSAEGGDRARMAKEALSLAPLHSAGSEFAYSNMGYVVAAHLAEQVTGKSWEALMQEELFAPLGMESAGFGPPARGYGDAETLGAPWGHSPDPVDPASVDADNPSALGPAGTVHASLTDLEKYLTVFWGGEPGTATQPLVSAATLAELLRPRLGDYAFGWGVGPDGQGGAFLSHDGSNGMFYCSIGVMPSQKDAVIVMTNRGDGRTGRMVNELMAYFGGRFLAASAEGE
ncbi:MAG: serine hydrolase [Thermoleophilia bacterium]|nr:serine hydrolase [Thermoleophilia bacterium]